MSNKIQLQNNNTQLASLIQTLQGKTVGGSGETNVNTCTIQLICNTSNIYGYSYLAYRDNSFTPVTVMDSTRKTLNTTLTDVICGGYIYIQTSIEMSFTEASITGNATYEKFYSFSSGSATVLVYAPNEANSSSTVTIIDND